MTQWMQFIQMRPNVVMIDAQQKVHLIRHKESLETMLRYEEMPKHLSKIEL
jgi:diaminopimelate decarboxylase